MTDAYDKVVIGQYSDGSDELANKRTVALLDVAGRRLGYSLTTLQGSYHTSVGASAGTHDGGGVIDLAPYEADRKVRALKNLGCAAWHRLSIPGTWVEHVHFVMRGDLEMSDAAHQQIIAFDAGLDGLADGARDSHPYRPDPQVAFDYQGYLHGAYGVHGHYDPNWRKHNRPPDNSKFDAAIKALREARRHTKDPGLRQQLTDMIRRLLKAEHSRSDTSHH